MGWRASRGAGEGARRSGQDDPEAVGKARYPRARDAPAVRDDVRRRVRRAALAPQGTMRTDACRARGQVRPQLEARVQPEPSNPETKTMNMFEAINSAIRSEERRVGKSRVGPCRSQRSPYNYTYQHTSIHNTQL